MAEYASNTPISGPRSVDWKISWDIGGMAWSHDWGMFYAVSGGADDDIPIRRPDPPSRRR